MTCSRLHPWFLEQQGGGKSHCWCPWREPCPEVGRWAAMGPWLTCSPLPPAGDAVGRPTLPLPGQGTPETREEEQETTPTEVPVVLGPSGTCSQPREAWLARADSRASPTS